MSDIGATIAARYKPLTKTHHRTQYPAIDPTNPANSAAGKTVVVSGGASGIGYLIARGFAKAGAATVVLIARRQEALDESAPQLRAEIAQAGSKTNVWTYCVNIRDNEGTKSVFDQIRKRLSAEGQADDADILVTSAAMMNQGVTTLEFDPKLIQEAFDTNVMGNLNLVRSFLEPEIPAIPLTPLVGPVKDTTGVKAPTREKIVLDVSSGGVYMKLPGQALYGGTKLAITHMLQHLQTEVDQLAGSPIRIHSFNPGVILSPASRKLGLTDEANTWDDESLPEGFAVWLASPAAEFLKGRFVWSSWDVDEMIAQKQKFEEDPFFCQFTLKL